MRYLRWILLAVLFFLLLGLTVKNTEPVTVRYLLGFEWTAPLALLLFIFFLIGVVLGVLAGMGWLYRLRRELSDLRREMRGRPSLPPADAAPERRLL